MSEQHFMRDCFRLALRGRGQVSPNPMVGAVLVRGGRVIARGFHRRFGGPHAEVECLDNASGDLHDAALYVNLEPCSHHGKTPPCADLIISRGVGRVVIAMEDPNPRVAGRGLRKLRRAGIRAEVGLLEDEACELNRVFVKHITSRTPYVHVKIAQSRDGKISGGDSRWISSPQSRKRVHVMRAQYDAVLVGAGTIRADDPALTVRLVSGRNPDVVVLDGALSLPPGMRLFTRKEQRRIFLFTTQRAVRSNRARARAFADRGVTLVAMKARANALDLRNVLKELYKRDIASVLVEGGASVFTQFVAAGLADELTLFVSPDLFDKGLAAIRPAANVASRSATPEKAVIGRSGRDMMITMQFNHEKR